MYFRQRLVDIICFIKLMESFLQLVYLIFQTLVFLVSIYFMILIMDFYPQVLSVLSEKLNTLKKSRSIIPPSNTIIWVYTFKTAKNLYTNQISSQAKQLVHSQLNLSNYQMKLRKKYRLIKSLDFMKKKKIVKNRNILHH